MQLGFIGLGIMGAPMAEHLCGGTDEVRVSDLDAKKVTRLEHSGAIPASSREIAACSDIIFSILPRGSIVQELLFGEEGLAARMKRGALFVDMSSVTPAESQACAAGLAPYGVGFLDAPVSGGEPGAIAGTLAIMVGGDAADFERAKPFLLRMGSSATLIGGSGSGSIAKLCNQIIVNTGITAVSEAMTLAAKTGVRTDRVYEAIRGGLAGSTVLDAKAPMMLHHDFTPGGTITVNYKDMTNVLSAAGQLGLRLPLAENVGEIMDTLIRDGYADCDHSGIVQYYEQRAGVSVACGDGE